MRLLKYAALACCAFLLGCSSDDSDGDAQAALGLPYIETIFPRIDHYHPTYWTKFDPPPPPPPPVVEAPEEIGLILGFDIQVRHSDGLSNLSEIFVFNRNENHTFNVPLEPVYPPPEQTSELLIEAEFSTQGIYEHSLQRVILDGYEVTAVDKKGNRTTRLFGFQGFNAESVEAKEYMYSAKYCPAPDPDDPDHPKCGRPGFEGLTAMETMEIDRNRLRFESDPGEESFHIGFTYRDIRARNYKIEFYGPFPELALIGVADFNSASIADAPLVFGRSNTLNLPYSEIVLEEGMELENIQDIDGIHIVLADELVEYELPKESPEDISETKWVYKYSGYSEFVELPTPPIPPIE